MKPSAFTGTGAGTVAGRHPVDRCSTGWKTPGSPAHRQGFTGWRLEFNQREEIGLVRSRKERSLAQGFSVFLPTAVGGEPGWHAARNRTRCWMARQPTDWLRHEVRSAQEARPGYRHLPRPWARGRFPTIISPSFFSTPGREFHESTGATRCNAAASAVEPAGTEPPGSADAFQFQRAGGGSGASGTGFSRTSRIAAMRL